MKQYLHKKQFKNIAVMSFATAIIAFAVYFFLIPSHASISSVSGLAMILSHFIPLKISVITMILNVFLLIIGFIFCGKEFGFKTVYTSILLPILLAVFEVLFPDFQSFTGSDVLDAAGYVFVVSIGLAILFNMNASSGGIDIVAKLMSKFLHMDLGVAMSFAGMVVALSSAAVYDSRTVVISVLGTYFNGIVIDHFIMRQSLKKRVCIVSEHFEEVRRFILEDLHSGATVYEAIGAYNMQPRREIIAVVDKNEYQKLMSWIEQNDPLAFITVYNVSDMRYRVKTRTNY
ncbi:MAG: YitT family protein [Lachnospiraceae bacterium]|nr:YitT family protein [Lachnospiraceae bacterium]